MQADRPAGSGGAPAQSPLSHWQFATLQPSVASQMPSPSQLEGHEQFSAGTGGGNGGLGLQSPPSHWHSATLQFQLTSAY